MIRVAENIVGANLASPLNRDLLQWLLVTPQTSSGILWRNMIQGRRRYGRNWNGELETPTAAAWSGARGRTGGYGSYYNNSQTCGLGSWVSLEGKAITIAMWIRPTDSGTNNRFLSNQSTHLGNTFTIRQNASTIESYTSAGGFQAITSSGVLSANQWTHFAAVNSSIGDQWTGFINGVQDVTETARSEAGKYNYSTIGLGDNLGTGFGNKFPGYFDDFRLWDRPLHAHEVRQVYLDSITGYRETLLRKSTYYMPIGVGAAPSGDMSASISFIFNKTTADLDALGSLSTSETFTFGEITDLDAFGELSSSVSLIFNETSDLDALGELDASISLVFIQSSDLDALGELDASVPLVFDIVTANLVGLPGDMSADGTLVFNETSDLSALGELDASVSLVFNEITDLDAYGELSLSDSLVFGVVSASLIGLPGDISASISTVFTQTSNLDAFGELSLLQPLVFTHSANLTEADVMTASINLVFSESSAISADANISSSLNLVFNHSANLTAPAGISASINIIFTESSNLNAVGNLSFSESLVFSEVSVISALANVSASLDLVFETLFSSFKPIFVHRINQVYLNEQSNVIFASMLDKRTGDIITSNINVSITKFDQSQAVGQGILEHEGNGHWSYQPTDEEKENTKTLGVTFHGNNSLARTVTALVNK